MKAKYHNPEKPGKVFDTKEEALVAANGVGNTVKTAAVPPVPPKKDDGKKDGKE